MTPPNIRSSPLLLSHLLRGALHSESHPDIKPVFEMSAETCPPGLSLLVHLSMYKLRLRGHEWPSSYPQYNSQIESPTEARSAGSCL